MQTLLKKWWILLLQGILLIVLSIYVFDNPGVTLVSLTFWISLMILFAGLAGIIGWLVNNNEERENSSLLWSIVSTLFGVLLIARIGFAMNLFTNLLGIWMVITGAWFIQEGWAVKNNRSRGWLLIITGLISIVAGFMVIFNIAAGALAVSSLVGIQILFAGIGLIILSLLKRKVVGSVKDAAAEIQKKMS